MKPVLQTSNADFIEKSGLDAYFFLRYLRFLLKIFVPAALVILPILLPLNKLHGKGSAGTPPVTGLDTLAWGNVALTRTSRYWAHWVLAVFLICYICLIVWDELRGYIRMRQAYLTSPQHRLRASATTVLISSIPRKWCTVEALDGLYDVFPGGIRNIWINRNFDELNEKTNKREKLSRALESAETGLIRNCTKAKVEEAKKRAKKEKRPGIVDEVKGVARKWGPGFTSGDPHQVKHTVEEATHDDVSSPTGSPRVETDGDATDYASTHTATAIIPPKGAEHENLEKDDESAEWRKYIAEKDRDTMRLPIFGLNWLSWVPFVGKKVDTIYYCRKELARLNIEIEDDQKHPERFPLLNSAFVQFNHQVAAHMACQSISHHIPVQMTPRLVEIDPKDVIWDNMSINWWQSWIRTTITLVVIAGMIILWAIPVAFSGALSQLQNLANTYHWLHWLMKLPKWFLDLVQGVLPAVVLAVLMLLLPMILRFLVKFQGVQSGMLVELSVQRYYFFFQFVQIFLVVTLSSSLSVIAGFIKDGVNGGTKIVDLFATNLPKAGNYFFSYMLLQALSTSAGALVQIGGLIGFFVLAPVLDSTARKKFRRQTSLSEVEWGTFFPVYTNLACIGLIYSVISPLILIFNIITFALFWFVYRYNTLYVTKFTRDTGGLLFPVAINYTFVGVYAMEVGLIGMFLLVRDVDGSTACKGQAIGMIVLIILTATYQTLLNWTFAPLYEYLPITLEDDAVRRDEEFALVMAKRHGTGLDNEDEQRGRQREPEDLQEELEERERRSREADRQAEEYEMAQIEANRKHRSHSQLPHYEFQNPEVNLDQPSKVNRLLKKTAKKTIEKTVEVADATADATFKKLPDLPVPKKGSWAERDRKSHSTYFNKTNSDRAHIDPERTEHHQMHPPHTKPRANVLGGALDVVNNFNPLLGDVEAQQEERNKLSETLFAGLNDELEDLSHEQRDALVQRAFQHAALRSKRPVIWIPRDDLGVSDDEIRRTATLSTNIWISNVRQGLDGEGNVVYTGAPPDFDEVDLITL